MGVIKDTLQKQINKDQMQRSTGTSATILEYDRIANVARISFTNPVTGEIMYRENVPVCITTGGINGGAVYAGQRCMITFANDNIFSPVITGITESLYYKRTSADQGAFLPDPSILSVKEPETIAPMSDQWIDYDNPYVHKYNNDISQFYDIDVDEVVCDMIDSLDKCKNGEQVITNLETHSTIKVKENGDIDIFSSNNLGIRISPNNRSINIYGALMVNGKPIGNE